MFNAEAVRLPSVFGPPVEPHSVCEEHGRLQAAHCQACVDAYGPEGKTPPAIPGTIDVAAIQAENVALRKQMADLAAQNERVLAEWEATKAKAAAEAEAANAQHLG